MPSEPERGEDLEATKVAGRQEALPDCVRATPTGRLGWRSGREVLGHRVVCKLGRGAVGAVYLVEEIETGEQRALKVVPAPDAATRCSFEREARIQQESGRHPNVAACYGAGELDGHLFLLLEYLPGGSLRERVRHEGPLPPREALEIAAQLAAGLSAVHACGVLHRDLKPANVMFDAADNPKLVDFGLASALDEALPLNILQGTPAFMAPEQAQSGLSARLSERTDVYGLGGILYYCLTATLPYACKSLGDLILELTTEDPDPPSVRAPEQQISPALDALVLRAMRRRPQDRFASAKSFADALRAELG